MTTQLMERTVEVSDSGDKRWLRVFNVLDSIERVKDWESRGTEFKVLCGLELYYAKLNFKKYGGWYPFLKKCDIYPSTAARRMQAAREFIRWAKILPPTQKWPEFKQVIRAMEFIDLKSCILQDFANSRKADPDKFYAEVAKSNKVSPEYSKAVCQSWYKRAAQVAHEIDVTVQREYLRCKPYQQQLFRDTTENIIRAFVAVRRGLRDIDHTGSGRQDA